MNALPQLDQPVQVPVQTPVAVRRASTRLSVFAMVVLAGNVLAAALAVVVNWPSQFGGEVGTDAGQEWMSRGTAISAPLAPILCFVLIAILVRIRTRAGWLGIGLTFGTAVVVFVGGMGELIAEPTVDVPRAVLVTAGVLWAVVAAILIVMGTAAARERRGHR